MNDLEEKIRDRIQEFDVISLLRLLISLGYSPDIIHFRSNDSICSQTGLIYGIIFRQKPFRHVVVTFNLGLLSAQSPLPAYFKGIMEQNDDNFFFFEKLCGYLDHHLIKDYLQNIYPELNNYYFRNWRRAKQEYLNLLNLKSMSSLHWLFKCVFPEIAVRVENAVLGGEIRTEAIRLGKTILGGDAVFGRKTAYPAHGKRVTLLTENEMTYTQIPWPREIEKRLHDILFPVLRPVGIDLDIILILKSQKRWAKLHEESFLGYDRIKTDEDTYRSIRIFQGHIGEL
jgi:hypothetical protein